MMYEGLCQLMFSKSVFEVLVDFKFECGHSVIALKTSSTKLSYTFRITIYLIYKSVYSKLSQSLYLEYAFTSWAGSNDVIVMHVYPVRNFGMCWYANEMIDSSYFVILNYCNIKLATRPLLCILNIAELYIRSYVRAYWLINDCNTGDIFFWFKISGPLRSQTFCIAGSVCGGGGVVTLLFGLFFCYYTDK